MKTILSILLLMTCLGIQAQARPVRYWQPKELEERASFVCEGIPTEIKSSEIKITKQLGKVTFLATQTIAKIKVVSVSKGQKQKSFEFRYWISTITDSTVPGTTPSEITMEVGERYQFYAVMPKGKDYFVGVLDAEFDDRQSVVAIHDPKPEVKNGDLQPDLKERSEVENLAKKYHPEFTTDYGCGLSWIGLCITFSTNVPPRLQADVLADIAENPKKTQSITTALESVVIYYATFRSQNPPWNKRLEAIFLKCVHGKDIQLRRRVVSALAGLPPDARKTLSDELLKDRSKEIRESTAKALKEIGK